MFGETYFAMRARLTGVMRGIASLAEETRTDLSDLFPDGEAGADLHEPFLFVVSGEVNCGKSTLLNGLFGRDICRTSALPETRRIIRHMHGEAPAELSQTALLVEKRLPLDFLRDFHLIDTPGTNSNIKDHQEALQPFLSLADLILVVFPVSNPWGAATWDFVSRIPDTVSERVVFIIQQCDQRGPADLKVILGHMRDLSMKRIGRIPPIYQVSAKLACEAKTTSPPSPGPWNASGYPALEEFIATRVCDSPARRKALDAWRYHSSSALRRIEDRLEEQSRAFAGQGRFLEDIEHEISAMRERFVNRLPRHLTGVAEVFQATAAGVSKTLDKRLGAARSIARLFTGDRTGHHMEILFAERLQATVEAVAETDGTEVVEACRVHWNDLQARVSEVMNVELGSPALLDQTLSAAKLRFIQRLGNAARRGIGSLKVRHQLDRDLRRRNLALKSFTATALLLFTAGAVCGALSLPWLPLLLCGPAGLFLAGGILTAWITRKAIKEDFQERLLDTCDGFASTLRNDYEEALRIVFQDYTGTLDAVRKHLAAEKLALEPRLQRWQDLFLTLKAIEQEI